MQNLHLLELHKQVVLLWLLVIAGFIVGNWYVLSIKKKHPKYDLQNVAKCLIGLGFFTYAEFSLLFIPYAFFSYGALFDPILNLTRGKNLFYLGHYTNSAKTDVWELKAAKFVGGFVQAVFFIEFILAMLSMGIYYTGWKGFVQQLHGTYDWSLWIW